MKIFLQKSPHEYSDKELSRIEYALNDDEKVRFFTRSMASPDWLDWLDKRGYLNDLFTENEWSRNAGLWARWLVEKFAVAHADRLQRVIGRRKGRLPAYFWRELANAVQSDDLNDEAFGQWVTLLLSRVPEDSDLGLELKILAEYCVQRKLMRSAFRIFETMLTANFDPATREFKLVYEHNHSHMLWVNILRRQLDQSAEHTLGRLIQRLEDRHETLSRWKSASLHHDQSFWIMGLIANLDPVNNVYGFASLTLYAARDCLDWLIKERREDGTYWQRRLAKSESPLLRALAVHSVRMDESMSPKPEQKAAWLLETNPLLEMKRINDRDPRQDLYKLAEEIYPRLNDERRKAMIESVAENRDVREQYEWYHCLLRSDPECLLAKAAFKEAQSRRPEWKPRNDSGDKRGGDESKSVSADQLLGRRGSEWVPELIDLFSQSSGDLTAAVTKAARTNFDWSRELADALAKEGEWETDAWLGLIEAWSHGDNMAGTDLDKDRYEKVVKWIANENLHGKEERDYFIIWTLNSLVVNGGAPYALELLSDTNRIAASLWDKIDQHDTELPAPAPFIDNRPASRLAHYWLDGLLLLLRNTESAPEGLEQDWKKALSKIAQDPSANGRIGRSTLAQRFALLLYVDQEWTKENLLPSFTDDDEFRSVWIGFLFRMCLTKETAEILYEPSLKAIDRILMDNKLSGGFIEYYVQMAASFIEDPLEKWIPEFFKRSSEENLRDFTEKLDNLIRLNYLREQEDALRDVWNRWLKRYWENRLDGVPKRFDDKEIAKMFSWPIYFGSAFPEAVELARRMKPYEPVGTDFVYWLSKSGLWSKYPDAAAEMLLHLHKISSIWFGSGTVKELIDNLLALNLPDNLKRDLEDLRATLS